MYIITTGNGGGGIFIFIFFVKSPMGGGGNGADDANKGGWQWGMGKFFFGKKCYQSFFDASRNKNIGANIRIGRKIRCLPYAGLFLTKSVSL